MTTTSSKQLGLFARDLPASIKEVVGTLKKAGFLSYVVGGGVRDSLLGLAPKDFDAVTDARPHQIKDIFGKRCRIIGRRFQLAHVYSGNDLIEVATFRAPPKAASVSDDGMILRDNVWGSIEQDAKRRDFSVNALYYQPQDEVVRDFCGALADMASKTLRLLGDPKTRIEEDPVRLLRALRFKAKLGFELDDALSAQFTPQNWHLLAQVSAHRLYDETTKMFCGGYLNALLPLLHTYGALDVLMDYPPKTLTPFLRETARNTDARLASGKSANPAFFFAVLLWDNYLHAQRKLKKRGASFLKASQEAAVFVLERQSQRTALPKFVQEFIADIWLLQGQLVEAKPRTIDALLGAPRFRAGFDFLCLREAYDTHPLAEDTKGMGTFWQAYLEADNASRAQMIKEMGKGRPKSRARQNRRHDDITPNQKEDLRQLQSLRGRIAQAPLVWLDENSVLPKAPKKKRPKMPAPAVISKRNDSQADNAKTALSTSMHAPADIPKKSHVKTSKIQKAKSKCKDKDPRDFMRPLPHGRRVHPSLT